MLKVYDFLKYYSLLQPNIPYLCCQPVVVMNWNIAEQLPETAGCRNHFNTILAGFINVMYIKLVEIEHCRKNYNQFDAYFGFGVNEHMLDYAKNLILDEISQNLFE